MRKVIYVVIRYSVLIENSKSWMITDPNLDKYRENLFDKDRLEIRLKLFKNITLPSLVGQEDSIKENNVKVVIITSEELPEWNKAALNSLTSGYEWINVHYLPRKGHSLVQPVYDDLEKYEQETLYATIRLDDDDALSIDFFTEFSKFFVANNIGYAISFGKGLCGFYDQESSQYYKVVDYYYPKLALGLGYINFFDGNVYKNSIKTIFQAGGHTKVDQYVPTIIYSKKIMYIRTMYEDSDSHIDERFERLKRLPPVEADLLEERFSLSFFDKKTYIESNNNTAYNLQTVDRTRYNKRYDIAEGKRIYKYIYNNIDIQFLSSFNAKSKKVIVILSEEVNRARVKYNYQMFPVIQEIKDSVFYILDPTISSKNNLSFGWFQGNKDTYALPIIRMFIYQLLETNKIDPANLTIFGFSAGGFSSLKLADDFPKSKIIVVNPQTQIFNYEYEYYEKIANWALPNTTPEQAKYTYEEQLKVKLNIQNRKSPIIYYQNVDDDHHLQHHLKPLLESLNEQEYEIVDGLDKEFSTDKNLKVIYYSDPKSGHSPLTKEDTVSILNREY